MRCDRLAKDQPPEIAMFQISEVEEAPAFNGRLSFLTLRDSVPDRLSSSTATPRAPFCYALSPRERESLESSTGTAFADRTIDICNMPLSSPRKKAPSRPPPMAPNDAPKSRSDKSELKMEIITRPNSSLAPTKPPRNKPTRAPRIAEIFVGGVLRLESVAPACRNPPTTRVQRRIAAPKKKMRMPSLPLVEKAHASRAIATHNSVRKTSRLIRTVAAGLTA
jgi:hypothetical protein